VPILFPQSFDLNFQLSVMFGHIGVFFLNIWTFPLMLASNLLCPDDIIVVGIF
jgi:hypothetical protein